MAVDVERDPKRGINSAECHRLIWKLAGEIGVHPDGLTLRQLAEMAEGRDRAEWGRLSCLLSVLANCNRDPKKRREPFAPSDFNPYEMQHRPPQSEHIPLGPDGILALKALFVDRRPLEAADGRK